MRKLLDSFRLFLKIYRLMDSGLWILASKATAKVREDRLLNAVAVTEDRLVFCSRCGQIPDGDRRMDEARQKLMDLVPIDTYSRSEVDAALALSYLLISKKIEPKIVQISANLTGKAF